MTLNWGRENRFQLLNDKKVKKCYFFSKLISVQKLTNSH